MSENKNVKKGGISVDTEHIFPIIKKWLYSDKDIFLREIVSNASDAITKLRRLSSLGIREDSDESYGITVTLDKENATLTVDDNGIGMTEEELNKYICSIALSGAVDFIQKYEKEDADNSGKSGIIGHFGLGFYSAFMVSDSVEIITKSYLDAPAVHWTCSDSGEYEISHSERTERGTTVIMHVSESEREFLQSSKIRAMLEKYCSFMPTNIYFKDIGSDGDNSQKEPINNTCPLWQKQPSECSNDDYNDFYRKVFNDFKEPLFHIHINADYPLNFKGILYFPKFANEYEAIEGQVKLYCNQVYVADNIKEVIPDYLLMLKGVLDCPELPLNVSRSYLQSNTYVSKISAHIIKKVADKLNLLCNNEREKYSKIWNDISPFVEYACIKDRKFYDRIKNSLLLNLCDGSVNTYEEYLNDAKQKHENKIYYTTDKALQAQYISMFEAQNIKVVLFDKQIDIQFSSIIEQYMPDVKFLRVDADIADSLKSEEKIRESEQLKDIFSEIVGENVSIRFDALKDTSIPAILNVSEESRRMEELMRMYGMDSGAYSTESSLILNTASPLIRKIEDAAASEPSKAKELAHYLYKLSLLSQKKFSAEEMQDFMKNSFELMMKL